MKFKLLLFTFLFSALSWGQATDLFISEYVEGSSNNKYIEIYNGTGVTVDLSDYRLRLYTNGSSTTSSDILLTGSLLDGQVIVYKNSSATIYLGAATNNAAVGYNGDDAVVLYKISTNSNVDIFGYIGCDPGSAWTAAGYSTADKTLRRKTSICGGITVNPSGTCNATSYPTLDTEWDIYNQDDVSGLGSHSATCSVSSTYVVLYDGNTNTGGTAPTDVTVYNSGDPVTVLGNTGSLVKTGFAFNGWNTTSDGSGTSYVAGNTFAIAANTTLYAQWLNTSPPVITSSLTASGNQGSAFTYTITATNTPTSYTATGLPAGLSINTVTGIISGTPTTTGTTNVTISATNAYGTDTQTLVITITTGPCLSESSFTSLPVGWIDNTITYSGGEAVFGGNNCDLTTLAVSNPASLTFDLRRTINATAKDFIIEVSTTTQGGVYTSVTTYNLGNTTSGGTTACTVDLSAYTSFPTVYIRFRKVSSTTSPWYLQNVNVFCGTPPDVEIDIQGNALSILDGDTTPSTTDDTDFGTALVGSSVSHTFTITNAGPDDLDISSITITGVNAADFYISINPASTVAGGGSTTFEVTFSPSAIGISNATINIANNDADENPYTFDITGEAITCAPTTSVSSIAPASGPVGTMVTINGSGFATATVVSFGGSSATFTIVSGSVIEAVVPTGTTTGNITIQDAGGCDLSYSSFTVITQDNSTCEGVSVTTDLIIYDIHDEKTLTGGFITIYNGTAATVDLTNYSLWRTSNYGDGNEIDYATTSGTIAPGALGILKVSIGSCGPASTNGTIDNGFNEDDGIQLRNADGSVIIDDVHTYVTAPGYYMVRNTGALSARTTYVAADWSITPLAAGVCYPSAGLVLPSGNGNSPLVTLNPVDVNSSCSSSTAALTVAGSEGVAGGLALAYQWYVNVPGNTGWTAVSNGGVYSGATSATLNISSTSGLNNYQYYCQIREDVATCYTATEAAIIKDGTTIWNGTVWSNGVPSSTMLAIINGNYDTSLNGNIECCSLIVNTGFTLDIQDANYVEIQFDLTVNGTLNVLNNGSLVQVDDSGVNTGNISYERSTSLRQLDYVIWSSPLSGFNINNVSPLSPTSLIWGWNPTVANSNGGIGNWVNEAGATMAPGVGYGVRGPSTFNTSLQSYTATFNNGVPNNGVYNVGIARGTYTGAPYNGVNGVQITNSDDNLNLIGNPYPSAIRALDFLTLNADIEGAVRIWTHGITPSLAIPDPFYGDYVYNYSINDYIVYNGTGTISGPSGYNGLIPGGQGFFVIMNDGAAATSSVLFNNSLRSSTYDNSQFYRTTSTPDSSVGEEGRIWLDLVDKDAQSVRTLVGYVNNATMAKDRMFDAVALSSSEANIYSLVNNQNLCIQGRALPFVDTDVVPIGVKIVKAGANSIQIATIDGLFTSQNIYLEDKVLGIIHNLKVAPYLFNSETGIFNERFVLRYTDAQLNTPLVEATDLVVYTNNGSIIINAPNDEIENITIHDVLGRVLLNRKVQDDNWITNEIQKNNQALIIKITLKNGTSINKKIIF